MVNRILNSGVVDNRCCWQEVMGIEAARGLRSLSDRRLWRSSKYSSPLRVSQDRENEEANANRQHQDPELAKDGITIAKMEDSQATTTTAPPPSCGGSVCMT